MKSIFIVFGLTMFTVFVPAASLKAQVPIVDIIKEGVKKVIKAVDLQIQRLQNETIWLQNAQKVLENKMSELKLGEISNWVAKQKELYANYFDELWKVKLTINSYQAVKGIIDKQLQLVQEYKRAMQLCRQDKSFTTKELNYMDQVYSGILTASLNNLDQVELVINAFATQMTDAKRLEILQEAGKNMEQNLADLRLFNQQNIIISLQRIKDANEIAIVKKLYGL